MTALKWHGEFKCLLKLYVKYKRTNAALQTIKYSLDIHIRLETNISVNLNLFSAPELKAHVHYCDHASSVHPSVVNFSHFQLLLWNRWMEFNETWQEDQDINFHTKSCYSGQSKKQGRPGLWLDETFSTFPLKALDRIQQNLKGSKISTFCTKFVFFRLLGITTWPSQPLLGWDIFDYSSETAEQNSKKLNRKQDLNVLYQLRVFWVDQKNKMAAPASFDFSSETAEWNSMKLHWKQDLNFLYQVCVFRPIRKVRWPSQPLIGWDIFQALNGIQQNLTGSKISTSSTKFVLFGPIGKTRWPPSLWYAKTFKTFPLKRLNRIQRNLMGSKISTSSTKFVFRLIKKKTRWRSWPLIGWDIFVFFSETAEQNSTKLDRKHDRNFLYQVCGFRADRKNKMVTQPSDMLRHFCLLLWNCWTEFNETLKKKKQDLNILYQVCVF